MNSRTWIILFVLWQAPQAFAQNASALPDLVRARLESAETASPLVIANQTLHASGLLRVVYGARGFSPVWIDARGPLLLLDDLFAAIQGSADHGLRPSDYHLRSLQQKVTGHAQRPLSGSGLIEIELLATDAFLVYASHLLAGHVDPNTVHVTWFIPRPEADLVALFEQAVTTGGIRNALEQVAPAAPAYRRLKTALADYRSIAARGGWPSLPPGPTLRAGDSSVRVTALRARLAVTDRRRLRSNERAVGRRPGSVGEDVSATARTDRRRRRRSGDAASPQRHGGRADRPDPHQSRAVAVVAR